MARKLRLYHGHESTRMEALEGLPLASFAARAIAFFIDMVLASLSYVVPAIIGAMVLIKLGWLHHDVHSNFDPFHRRHEASAWEELANAVWFVTFIAASNYIGNGATIGKRVMKIRVVSLVHRRLTLWTSIERALGYGASALEAFFGFFQYFLDANRRTVHDRIAETIVVSERKPAAPATLPVTLEVHQESSPALPVPDPAPTLADPATPSA
jgi:uncharacterized RDD family membrane protein YckC